jgi:hypothetical protein
VSPDRKSTLFDVAIRVMGIFCGRTGFVTSGRIRVSSGKEMPDLGGENQIKWQTNS